MDYDRQLIVALLDGDDDASTRAQAEALGAKQRKPMLPSEVVLLKRTAPDVQALRDALAGRAAVAQPVTARSRLYVLGRGHMADRKVAGWSGEAMAGMLAAAGLRAVGMISIVAEGAGRDPDRADRAQTDDGAQSFASQLHRALRDAHGIWTSVHARIGAVRVQQTAPGQAVDTGRKLSAPHPGPGPLAHHAPGHKIRIDWDGSAQRMTWAY